MALVINTNVMSLNAQRNLSTSANQLATSLQRLSSGLRINSAKDDAAGLAISERLSAQISGLNVAARNANDGISLAQTAEGDLAQIGNNLQRMRELAVQSANASNSVSDRAALNAEVQQLAQEIDRVAQASSFNGVKLLDGSFQAQVFQVGANATSTDQITVDSITNARSSALGAYNGYNQQNVGVTYNATAQAFTASIATASGTQTVNFGTLSTDAKVIAQAINSSGVAGLQATADANVVTGTTTNGVTVAGTDTITLNGTTISIAGTTDALTNRANAVTAINAQSATTGVSAVDTGSGLRLTAADGRNISVAFGTAGSTGGDLASYGLGGLSDHTGTFDLTYQAATGVNSITFGGALATTLGTTTHNVGQTGNAISTINVSTAENARNALASIDAALSQISGARATLGATQNRFTSVVASLQTTAENLSASRSRIQDADFASETAAMTKAQILQQAGTAMVAQANSAPQNVLSLLRG
ncbi:flagellin [Steroidobacter sp.]|uniref:flagellin N-terminal helical domain-containing protein n=1 Tax=Steroidobacter sp. TaxID=1978227 RepID=UPI001A46768B|nr:flagellin [Steroidobacter sp.]MBL8266925.1 flagellin [Steroidobacter sp.]